MSLFPPKIGTFTAQKNEQKTQFVKRPVMHKSEPALNPDFSAPSKMQAQERPNQMQTPKSDIKPTPQTTAPQSQNVQSGKFILEPQAQTIIQPDHTIYQPNMPTKEQQLEAIRAELKKAAQKPDPIACEHLGLINEVDFSDVYITPDKKCYTWAAKTDAGLKVVTFEDYPEFLQQLENTFDGKNRSYLLTYHGRHYRVERTIAGDGVQYCARKMPVSVPNLKRLGLPDGLYKYLLSLSGRSGLILLAGPTGSGKSTTISALLQEYLSQKGGYCYTIEDPIELPLDGVYVTPSGELGLCKQTVPPDGIWEEGIKSALRSKPRYIYLGEIRSPDVASEALRAATSGHLVLSTIHANNVSDSINSLVKYAASSGISEDMAFELVANGFLACLHQILSGAPKKISVTYVFANPDLSAGCQVRSMFRNGKLNLSTVMEQQKIKLEKGMPLF